MLTTTKQRCFRLARSDVWLRKKKALVVVFFFFLFFFLFQPTGEKAHVLLSLFGLPDGRKERERERDRDRVSERERERERQG